MSDAAPNPYSNLPEKAFWKTAVASRNPFEVEDIWTPKFPITRQDKVVTFGSCFAQHIGRSLRERGYSWHITEPPPNGLSEAGMKEFNYNIFSCRTGNIYTTSLLRQWMEWAFGDRPVPDEYWTKGDRIYDPFRPRVEPDGFASVEEMRSSRDVTIAAFRRAVTECRYFVFTLGLTESWFNKAGEYEYPMCPGTAAGTFDPDAHVFVNQGAGYIHKNLSWVIDRLVEVNPKVRVILTVSPVPLTATNSGNHVVVATMESKSTLRTVAGWLSSRGRIDYFPSYELVNAPSFRGSLFEPNMRNVSAFGVRHVMNTFFTRLHKRFGNQPARAAAEKPRVAPPTRAEQFNEVCEEQLLEAFGARA